MVDTLEIRLSEKQQQIVSYQEGAILVRASAGSGKTRVLTERIKKLLPLTKRKILAITFTNKAGAEIKERLEEDIPNINERLFVGTFHGFCQNILQNHGAAVGLKKMPHIFENQEDRLKLIEQAIEFTPSYFEHFKKEKKKKQFLYRAQGFISKIKRELCTTDEINTILENEDRLLFYSSYQEILQSQNAIDFDDLILLVYQLFITNPKIAALYRRSYEYIFVDEAQDLNNAQYQLLMALTNGEHKNIMLVGDPNQSIYAFNGSSSKYMEKDFIKDFEPLIIDLNENYRSSIAVVEAAKKIMPNADPITNVVLQGDFQIHAASDEEKEAEWIISKIQTLINQEYHADIEGIISYEKITILARTKYVFNQLEDLLKAHAIPYHYKITSGSIKFETKYMKVFDLALRVKLNPLDALHCNELIHLIKTDYSSDLKILAERAENNYNKKMLQLVDNLNENGSNLKPSLNHFKEIIKVEDIDENEKKMIIDEIDEVIKHWLNYAKRTDNKSLHRFKNAMALGQTHSSTQNEGITLSTVHTMKGQENEIIFIMGMDDGTFPYYLAVRKVGIDMVQEKNNAYVAFTRAKRFLYVTWPKKRMMSWGDISNRPISRFLKPFQQTNSNGHSNGIT